MTLCGDNKSGSRTSSADDIDIEKTIENTAFTINSDSESEAVENTSFLKSTL